MQTGLYDWETISTDLAQLRRDRKAIEATATAEVGRLEETMHTANKNLGKFFFKLVEERDFDNPFMTVTVSLVDFTNDYEFPALFQASYFYEGHCESYFILPVLTNLDSSRKVNSLTHPIGSMSSLDWFAPLGDLAKFVIRDTPRPRQAE